MKVLSHHMYIVYQAYLRDRNPQLDDLLQLDSEYAYHLLHLFLENSDYKPYNPIEKYKEALLTDPDWALRWCLEQNDSLFYPKVMKHLVGTKDYNARSAIVLSPADCFETGPARCVGRHPAAPALASE